MDYGIDLSHYNAITDAHAVRDNGITFAWCKATEGTDNIDPTFAAKVGQLRDAGIVVGAYHYLRAGDPTAQARHFRDVAAAAGCLAVGALMPMIDAEADEIRGNANGMITAFYDALGGIAPVDVYGNLDWWTHTLQPGSWGGRAILGHIARYNGQPGQPGWSYPRLACHQHTSNGTVPGIPGAVDRDATVGTYTLQAITIGNVPAPTPAPPAPTPTPAPPPPAGDTWTVRAGDTLSRIASVWNVTVSALAVANGIANPDLIRIGQIIRRPGSGGTTPVPAPTRTYTVKRGDVLSRIAAALGTTVPHLVAINHLSNPDRIFPGQVLHY